MKSWFANSNGIFWAATISLALSLCVGCKTTEEKAEAKKQTIINLHLEVNPGQSRSSRVPVFRERPEMVNVREDPFLSNADIAEAALVDLEGGFGIKLRFDTHGAGVLENTTAANIGKRIAVYAAFPQIRWIASPRIVRRISDGVFVFTPDASQEEAERIVAGINNVAIKLGQQQPPGKK